MENSIFFSFFCFPVSRLNCCLDFFAIKSQLKAQKLSLTNRLSAFISGYNLITMEKFLALVEQKQEIEIDENKLKHMISIISIWDFFGISQSQYFLLSVKKKTEMLKKYYTDNVLVFYGDGKISYFVCLYFSKIIGVNH